MTQHAPIKLFCFDLNWSRYDKPVAFAGASAAQDWAAIDPQAYFDFHLAMGNNVMFCQAYAFGGYAFYPTRLGPVAPGAGRDLLPRLWDLSLKKKIPFWSYFCVGTDVSLSALMAPWLVPKSRFGAHPFGFLAPETPWTDLLCERVKEFLTSYPVDWLLFDWFVYGNTKPADFQVQPAWFVEKPFLEIIGRPMPEKAEDITLDENLRYKREVLARQFRRLRDTVRQTSPRTKIIFNVPYWEAAEPLWVNHPMPIESDGLFAECTKEAVVEWLLKIRKPNQTVMTTLMGHAGQCDPDSWRKWFERGCDFSGYAWGTPPLLKLHPSYDQEVEIIRNAFQAMP